MAAVMCLLVVAAACGTSAGSGSPSAVGPTSPASPPAPSPSSATATASPTPVPTQPHDAPELEALVPPTLLGHALKTFSYCGLNAYSATNPSAWDELLVTAGAQRPDICYAIGFAQDKDALGKYFMLTVSGAPGVQPDRLVTALQALAAGVKPLTIAGRAVYVSNPVTASHPELRQFIHAATGRLFFLISDDPTLTTAVFSAVP